MKQFIRPSARDDIIRQFRWYLVHQGAPDAAFRFVDAVYDAVEQLLSMPHIGAQKVVGNPALKGLRFWPVKDFEEFLIFYLVQGDTVRVVRVLHGKRDIENILNNEADDDTLH